MPLAVASPKRLPDFPDLPTVAETLPGFEAGGWQVLVAPVGTPDAIVQKVNADLIKALTDPETRKRLASSAATTGRCRPRKPWPSSRASSRPGRRSSSRSAARAERGALESLVFGSRGCCRKAHQEV